MELDMRQSGLIVPKAKEPPKPPKPVSLAFEGRQRDEAAKAFQSLMDLTRTGMVVLPGSELQPIRRKLVRQLAELLVGEDVEFEELC